MYVCPVKAFPSCIPELPYTQKNSTAPSSSAHHQVLVRGLGKLPSFVPLWDMANEKGGYFFKSLHRLKRDWKCCNWRINQDTYSCSCLLIVTYHTPSVQQSPHGHLVGFPWWRAVSWPYQREQEGTGLVVWGAEESWVWVKPVSAKSGALWPRRLHLPSPRACREGQAPRLLGTALFHSVGRDEEKG